jgi:hypothetical protein
LGSNHRRSGGLGLDKEGVGVADKIIRLHALMQVDRFELHVSSIMQGRSARWSCIAPLVRQELGARSPV